MSHLLWKYFYEDDVGRFRRLLAPVGVSVSAPAAGTAATDSLAPDDPSPRLLATTRKFPASRSKLGSSKSTTSILAKSDVNSRDHAGLTILLRASSSSSPSAKGFVECLLAHPSIDMYIQDNESGWNPLHRALYHGNISIARLLLDEERWELTGLSSSSRGSRISRLIKTKDREGNSPFDLYNRTIGCSFLETRKHIFSPYFAPNDESFGEPSKAGRMYTNLHASADGDELFVWGSNKNLSLGVGEDSDRQFPERVSLKRPDHLVFDMYREYYGENASNITDVEQLPTIIRNRPIRISQVILAKFSTAILTSDKRSNLYMCGIGRGGRLGLGNEDTQFRPAPVQGPLRNRKTTAVALGDFHSMAVTSDGELWAWGSNAHSQLGFSLSAPIQRGEEPIASFPRQVFGSLRKEEVQGVAASAVHSIAFTTTAIYCWGRNLGQLGIMDADSRSLEVQRAPRRVAASLFTSGILMVSAIEKATSVLLQNNTVCVFTQYGYKMVRFPFDELTSTSLFKHITMSSRYDAQRRQIRVIASGGSSVVALTGRGDLFTCDVITESETGSPGTSTTNPSKIKGALTKPICVWSASNKDGVCSVDVGENGSVIICTESGACWTSQVPATGYSHGTPLKRSDFKFQRVPHITNIVTVSASAFGAFAAIRKDSDIMKEQIEISEPRLVQDISDLCCLRGLRAAPFSAKDSNTICMGPDERKSYGAVVSEILASQDLESDVAAHVRSGGISRDGVNVLVSTSLHSHIEVPAHGFILAARSPVLRAAFSSARKFGTHSEPDGLFSIDLRGEMLHLVFSGVDMLTLLNVIVFAYQDAVVPIWNFARQLPRLAHYFRRVRLEVMKLGFGLRMTEMESAARLQQSARKSLHVDLRQAIGDPRFFEDADLRLQLLDHEFLAHSALLCRRSPFFDVLFRGRSRGSWLEGRRENDPENRIPIDLRHMHHSAFHLVFRHLYTDASMEMFQDFVSPDIDEFAEMTLEVMGIGNELLMSRLVQLTQLVLAHFVTSRNLSQLLNETKPCFVSGFKNAGLEYVSLQLEGMLENGLLDDLDDVLLRDLEERVRGRQASQLPVSKSNMAELQLHSKYPHLATEISEERRVRLREMAYRTGRVDGRKLSSFKNRCGGLGETPQTAVEGGRCTPQLGQNESPGPILQSHQSSSVGVLDMKEDEVVDDPDLVKSIPSSRTSHRVTPRTRGEKSNRLSWHTASGPNTQDTDQNKPQLCGITKTITGLEQKLSGAWSLTKVQPNKLALKEIMSEANPSPSFRAAGFAAQSMSGSKPSGPLVKMSQKQRKKQRQLLLEEAASADASHISRPRDDRIPPLPKASPWKTAPIVTNNDNGACEIKGLTVPGQSDAWPTKGAAAKGSTSQVTAPPKARLAGVTCRAPENASPKVARTPLVPHSRNYKTPATKAKPAVSGFALADIIGQQEREQDRMRNAVAKRSLKDIQQEQEFEEWWDQESMRTQEEARRMSREPKGEPWKNKHGGFGNERHRNEKQRGKREGARPSISNGGEDGGSSRINRTAPSGG